MRKHPILSEDLNSGVLGSVFFPRQKFEPQYFRSYIWAERAGEKTSLQFLILQMKKMKPREVRTDT